MKYSPLKDTLEGKRVVMVDDSIVRGTTTDKLVRMLYDAGAKEVHVRITAPPVKHPCYYGIDMANQNELVAAKHSVDEIRRMIGAASLGYLSLEGVARGDWHGKREFLPRLLRRQVPDSRAAGSSRQTKMMQEKQRDERKTPTIWKAAPTTVPLTTRNSQKIVKRARSFFRNDR